MTRASSIFVCSITDEVDLVNEKRQRENSLGWVIAIITL